MGDRLMRTETVLSLAGLTMANLEAESKEIEAQLRIFVDLISHGHPASDQGDLVTLADCRRAPFNPQNAG